MSYTTLTSPTGETFYMCSLCTRLLRSLSGMKYHLRKHSGIKPFVCHICSTAVTSSTSLTYHYKHIHNKGRPYKCHICHRQFKNKLGLKRHCETFHRVNKKGNKVNNKGKEIDTNFNNKSINKHKCGLCDKKFLSLRHLREHMSTHNAEAPLRCDICLKEFPFPDHLKRHLQTHDVTRCPHCNKTFKTKYYLKHEHEPNCKASKGKEHSNKCAFCKKMFISAVYLKFSHPKKCSVLKAKKRRNMNKYKCNICKVVFTSGSRLQAHKRKIHRKTYEDGNKNGSSSDKKPQSTTWVLRSSRKNVYDETFVSPGEFHCHKQQHDRGGENKVESRNGKQIETEPQRNESKNNIENENVNEIRNGSVEADERMAKMAMVRPYHCTDKSQKVNEIKTTKKRYHCEVCGMNFKSLSGFTYHARGHTGEFPYKCNMCDAKYTSPGGLYYHLTTHGQTPHERRSHISKLRSHISKLRSHVLGDTNDCGKATVQSISESEQATLKPEQATLGSEESTSKPAQSTLEPARSTLKSVQFTLEPEQSIIEPEQPIIEPEQSIIEPEQSIVKSDRPMVESERSASKSAQFTLEPEQSTIEHDQSTSRPEQSTLESSRDINTPTTAREKSYECDICSKKFHFEHSLRLHKSQHVKETSHKCERCKDDKTYTSREIAQHRLQHELESTEPTGINYVCFKCNASFDIASRLIEHVSVCVDTSLSSQPCTETLQD